MKVIYKHPLLINDEIQKFELGHNSVILNCMFIRGKLVFYALIDLVDRSEDIFEFKIVGTGHQADLSSWNFLGSVTMMGEQLVWHVFWRKK